MGKTIEDWGEVFTKVISPLRSPKFICAPFCSKIIPQNKNQADPSQSSSILIKNYSNHTSKNGPDFIPVYHFPYIRVFAVINRIKKYQTILTGGGIPVSLILNQLGQISMDFVQFTTVLGLSGCLVLHTAGFLTSKFIGIIYYNKSGNTAKISYVDFWGTRKDLEIPIEDIMPINELPRTPMDGLYFIFRRFSTKETLRLCLKYGVILDNELIKKVL